MEYPKTIYTHFGKARINNEGYYVISGTKNENYRGKLLHRLIWEKYNGPISKGYHIHHIDDNKLNNRLNNLECLSDSAHSSLHRKGENHPRTSINKVGASCIKILLQYTELTHQEIADSIPGATKHVVDHINAGNNWKDVTIYDFKSETFI
jgi:hypothetical protein